MHSFWKLLGLISSIIGGFFASAISMGYAWGGSGVTIEYAVVPRVAGILFFVSIILLFVFIYALVSDISKIKIVTISYIAFAVLAVMAIFLFKRDGLAYNQFHNTAFECSLFSGSFAADMCNTELAKAKNDIRICGSITSTYKSECTSYFAQQAGDVSLCQSSDALCFQSIAKDRKDPKICALISNDGARSNCYSLLAEVTNDKSICRASDNGSSNCNQTSLVYSASKIIITATAGQSSFIAGTSNVKLGTINISAQGGDGALSGISIMDRSPDKVKNLKMLINGNAVSLARAPIPVNNAYISNSTQYDFSFGTGYLIVRANKPTVISIVGDIPSDASGKNLYIQLSGTSYPVNVTVVGGDSTVVSAPIN